MSIVPGAISAPSPTPEQTAGIARRFPVEA